MLGKLTKRIPEHAPSNTVFHPDVHMASMDRQFESKQVVALSKLVSRQFKSLRLILYPRSSQ